MGRCWRSLFSSESLARCPYSRYSRRAKRPLTQTCSQICCTTRLGPLLCKAALSTYLFLRTQPQPGPLFLRCLPLAFSAVGSRQSSEHWALEWFTTRPSPLINPLIHSLVCSFSSFLESRRLPCFWALFSGCGAPQATAACGKEGNAFDKRVWCICP